jgi:hypothetical protein
VKKHCQQHNLLKGATNQSYFHETPTTTKQKQKLENLGRKEGKKNLCFIKGIFLLLKSFMS